MYKVKDLDYFVCDMWNFNYLLCFFIDDRECYMFVDIIFGKMIFYIKVYMVWMYVVLIYIILLIFLVVLNCLIIMELMCMCVRRIGINI